MSDAAAELAAALRPDDDSENELIAGGGNYVRRSGTWLYADTGDPVPGAADLTFGESYASSPRVTLDGHEYVLLDRAWLTDSEARPELQWCQDLGDTARVVDRWHVAVPVAEMTKRADVVIGLSAPELNPADLLTAGSIARLLGVARGTVNAYRARRQMPPPVVTLGQRLPLWSRPVVEHWIEGLTRRHRQD